MSQPDRLMVSRRHMLGAVGALALAPWAAGAYAVGVEPMRGPLVTTYRITPPGWPPALRVRVAALADIHACEPFMSAARVREIALATNALAPDLIVLMGDYNGGHRFVSGVVTPAAWGDALAVLRAPLGVYGILGNHDWWHGPIPGMPGGAPEVRQGLRSAGVTILENDIVRLEADGRPFWLAGLADQMAYRSVTAPPTGADDLPGTLKHVTDDAPILMLIHEPFLFRRMPDRVSLTLCGHTHGGQVRVPLLGEPFSVFHHYRYGHLVERGRHLVISGGLGESGFPARLGVPPEIVLLELGGDPVGSAS